ncbi:zinc-dependent metalloprotease [Phenylobacterium sp.]|uniref:zinc-dependent metalloprotease n=1 Tax=Phenylobacterium sp. TaxID=1871053 RepID=UPI002731D44A|nr:zinc-dependent metalloprotease [Phenylobacterium sp.]MDP2214041.1 zinc-dependent metalloprotease [Phenylobacterium sp.]
MNRNTLLAAVAVAALFSCPLAVEAAPRPLGEVTAGLSRTEGLIPIYADAERGRVLMLLPAPDAQGISGRYIHVASLRTGLGSAPIGLDKARLGPSRLLTFRRVGGKVVAEYENPRFRAVGAPAAEQASARDAFAPSLVWAGEVLSTDAQGRILIDISSFLTQDVLGVADAMKNSGETGWSLSKDLSLADPSQAKTFPENVELEAIQTYVSETPGREVANITPDAKRMTLKVRHSFVKLPEPGYQPRTFDPRSGGNALQFLDFAAPLGEPIVKQYALRFRLEKTDPTAAVSPVKKPIVFYMDPAAPEPIRNALMEGAAWWSDAFEAAGFKDAYRVELLPPDADPLDVRYSVINWADRATRGWSYGQTIIDPRTGEILKGAVVLGALRVRQDMLIFEGLVGADQTGKGGPNDPAEVALARLRQLGAHEVGHSIGFAHNFAGSTQGRTSVMDYPAPRILLTDGRIDLSDAYATGIGDWDKLSVAAVYGPEDQAQALLHQNATAADGLRYITDADSRGLAVGQPWGSLWDDGPDPAAELDRMMAARRTALANFGLGALYPGEPVAALRRKFVPIYLMHRYQVEAAGKLLGGVDFAYSVIGDGKEASAPVPAPAQRTALTALLATLDPAALETPRGLMPLMSAGVTGRPDRQTEIELFPTLAGPIFDPLAAAEVAASLPLDVLLNDQRLARLIEQHRRDPSLPGADEVMGALVGKVFADPADPVLVPIAQRTQARAVLDLGRLAQDPGASPGVTAQASAALRTIAARLKGARGGDAAAQAHRARLVALIENPAELRRLAAAKEIRPETPPGMPIGSAGWLDMD